MKVLTRYLLRAHLGPFVFAFVTLTGVILINTLAKELANLAGKGLPLSVVFEFFVLSLPANIALTLPMAVLVAVLYTFTTLAAENEITALRASGIDLRRATMPLVLLAIAIAGGMVWFNDQVLPAANYRWRVLMTDVAQTRPLLALREQAINPIRTSDGRTPYYLEAQRIDAQTGLMLQISIYDVSNEEVSRTIRADSGRMEFNPSHTDLLLTLFDGTMREVDFNDPASFQRVAFDEQVMRMKGVSDRLERSGESSYRTDRDMTVAMMRARIDTLRVELAEVRTRAATDATVTPQPPFAPIEDTATTGAAEHSAAAAAPAALPGELASQAEPAADGSAAAGRPIPPEPPAREAGAGEEARRYAASRAANLEYQIREYQVEVQKKYSIAVATLVFVLIGIPTALRFPTGGIGMVVAVSLAIFGVYYVGLIGGETLGDEGYVTPIVAMWATNILFGALGLFGFVMLGREHGTSRGGGWGDFSARFGNVRSRLRRGDP
ncbi:MAG TPA: LptF/LptG family permease [Longimicrobiaceae bacterium]|nr:LptF/LptG family permease [Longimicrobiaceae bacterium]